MQRPRDETLPRLDSIIIVEGQTDCRAVQRAVDAPVRGGGGEERERKILRERVITRERERDFTVSLQSRVDDAPVRGGMREFPRRNPWPPTYTNHALLGPQRAV